MKFLVTVLLAIGPVCLSAQTWKLNLETGMTTSRLLPSSGCTPATGTINYGYSKPGIYIAPEVQLKINEHLDAGFNYQYTNAIIGVQHRSNSASINNYDGIDMHSFNLGLYTHTPIFHKRMKAGAFAKAGFSYNKMVMMGSGGSSGGDFGGVVGGGPSYSYMNRTSGFEAMSGAWTPTATVGLSLGTNSNKWIADRLSLRWSATMGFMNTYNSDSFYDYAISTPNGMEAGRVRYQGIPFVMQFGINYRIAGFGGKG